ncbi:glycine-rich cell wall structural protein [Sesamum indicum]|uniref:Glycine-rich cell wall structural protein n=1 Tax=Sesamum indicum TaxID=4182 RepID=A0A6I9UP13_SESIN|nr:glycine-rich cell wall structural protein [Sesamum indicum]
MKYRAFILIALVLVCSVFAAEKSQHETKEVAQNEIKGDETKHTNTHVGHGGGTGVDAGAWFMGRGGGMAGGMGGAPAGGGITAAEAKAYKETRAKVEIKN